MPVTDETNGDRATAVTGGCAFGFLVYTYDAAGTQADKRFGFVIP